MLHARSVRLMLAVLMAGALILAALPALAGVAGFVNITSYTITCTSASVSYESSNPGVNDFAEVTVFNNTTGSQIAGTLASPWSESGLTLTYPAQPSGSEISITVDNNPVSASTPTVMVSACGGLGDNPPAPQCADGRINYNHCDKLAIYPVHDEDSYGVEIWIAQEGGVGRFAFFVSAQELDALPANPDEPIKVKSSEDGLTTLYKLPSGEYLVTFGPDFEGKVFDFVFDGLPPTNYPAVETYIVGG